MELEMLQDFIPVLFQVCIIPLLGVLTTFFVKWVNAKSAEIQTNIDDVTLNKYLQMLTETITDCVIATNQTFVESLKAQGKFDEEAQKEAFRLTSMSVIAILTDDAKEYLTNMYGDLSIYITNMIEAEVNRNRLTA